jgi:type IV pilus assembly protein PilM
MKQQPGVWGIDLGQCALKALRLEDVEGQVTATAFDYVEYPKILSQPDADPDQLIREALEQFLSRNSLRGDLVGISVPGQSGLARFVKLPPVEEKKIADIVKFEAKQQIPFNLDEVVWDYQKIGSSNVVDGFALETEIGLFAMKRDMVNRYLQHFKDVGVEVQMIQMAPLALCNFVSYDLLRAGEEGSTAGRKACVVALDIGADSSNLVITDGERIIWQRPIPLGGNHFTRALTKDLKLTFAKAEHLKRNATKSGADQLKKILQALKPVLNDFVGEVQRSLGYFTNTHRDAQVEYLVGLGNAFRLPGLQRFLQEKLQLEVRKLDKLRRLAGDSVITAPVFVENLLSFGVAYGLAIQGVKKGQLSTNLLPHEIRTERMIRAKKPLAAATAAVLLLGLGAVALGDYLDVRPYVSPQVKTAIEKTNSVAKRAADAENAFQTAKTNAEKEEEAVKSIVAGQPERLNWIKMLQFLSETIPQPDGTNLPTRQAVATYWENKPDRAGRDRKIPLLSGKEAFDLFKERLEAGSRSSGEESDKDEDTLPPGIDDLVQFQIEGVDCRYCDDLKDFWEKATVKGERKRTRDDVRPMDQFSTPPEGKGWVIEIQGYTYHHKQTTFIRQTLLENIARLGIKKRTKPAEGATGGTTPPTTTSPAPAPAGGAAKDLKVDLKATEQPVIDRISHVLLYRSVGKQTDGSGTFEFLGQSQLAQLIGSGPGGGMGPGGKSYGESMMSGPPPGVSGSMMRGGAGASGASGSGGSGAPGGSDSGASSAPSRAGWTPLGGHGGGSSGGGMGGATPPSTGRGGAGSSPGGGGMRMTGPAGLPGAGSGTTTGRGSRSGTGTGEVEREPRKSTGSHYRTEFAIFLVWKEPIPSDDLRTSAAGTTGTTGTPTSTPTAGK